MKFSHVAWDFDGTLFDTYPIMAKAFQMTLAADRIDEPVETICALMRISMGHAVQFYKKKYEIGDAFLVRFKALSLTMQQEHVKPYDGILEICRAIHENGGMNHLYTHRGESSFYFMDKFGLPEVFTELITELDGFAPKPAPDALLSIVKKHSFEPRHGIMIGDRGIDILAAKNAGMASCFFSEEGKTFEEADYAISDFKALYPILEL